MASYKLKRSEKMMWQATAVIVLVALIPVIIIVMAVGLVFPPLGILLSSGLDNLDATGAVFRKVDLGGPLHMRQFSEAFLIR